MTRKRSVRSGFEQRLLRTLRTFEIEPGDRLVIGFSGGSDSLALAAALGRIAPVMDLALLLVHVDHGLRAGSGADAQRAGQLADILGIQFEGIRLESGLAERSRGLGLEEAGRRERYLALASAAMNWQAHTILLAHQANDQAETVLLHLFRGSGLRGISGMSPLEVRPIPWWNDSSAPNAEFRIVRPLLSERRSDIEAYVSELGLAAIDDPSNDSSDFDRNWIRHQILPSVEERWPAVVASLGRSARSIRIDDSYLATISRILDFETDSDRQSLSRDKILHVDRSIAYRRIREWLGAIGVADVTFDVVERCYALAERNDTEAAIEASANITVVMIEGRMTTLAHARSDAAHILPMDIGSNPPDWVIEILDDEGDADCVLLVPPTQSLVMRTVRAGDRWFGNGKPVKEDLRLAGISPHLRGSLLCIATEDGVLLIPAIYPTIRSTVPDAIGRKVGIRWRRAE